MYVSSAYFDHLVFLLSGKSGKIPFLFLSTCINDFEVVTNHKYTNLDNTGFEPSPSQEFSGFSQSAMLLPYPLVFQARRWKYKMQTSAQIIQFSFRSKCSCG